MNTFQKFRFEREEKVSFLELLCNYCNHKQGMACERDMRVILSILGRIQPSFLIPCDVISFVSAARR